MNKAEIQEALLRASRPELAEALRVAEAKSDALERKLFPELFSEEQIAASQSSKPMLILEVVDGLLAQKRDKNLRDTTLRRYAEMGHRFARVFPSWPTPEETQHYLHQSAPTNRLNHHNFLKMLFKYAAEEKGLPNPMAKMETPRVREKPKSTIWPEQVANIEASIQTDMERKAWVLGYGMGWRLSEIQRLTKGDIGDSQILVHGKERDEWMALLPEIRDVVLSGTEDLGPTDAIFRGQRGPMSNNGIWRMVRTMLARAGVKGSTHTLRHGYATALVLQGCDAHTIMRLMRHKTLKEAIRYIHMAEPHLAERQRKYCPLEMVKNSQQKGAFVISEEAIASSLPPPWERKSF